MVETQGIRLQKVLSQAGIASRRVAEKNGMEVETEITVNFTLSGG